MFKENDILKGHRPCAKEVEVYLRKWDELDDYVDQERALDKLFLELCPDNKFIEEVLVKCSTLNDFYSTNIFKIHNVAQHYMGQRIDQRLAEGDLSLVGDLAHVSVNGKPFFFYSFATKYCSHHRPDVYPIYDSYVHQLLVYFKNRDAFCSFFSYELKDYVKYVEVILSFRRHYDLEAYSVKELDKYLWQLGKEAFAKY